MNFFKINIPDNRNFGLDLLRFLAIFNVLLNHSNSVITDIKYSNVWYYFDGVLLFFVLSGFLIGRIFIREFSDEINFKKIKNFWKRRWYRTLPAYYFTIIIILLLSLALNQDVDYPDFFKSLIFIQNINISKGLFFDESWSLAVEEWFYLLLPILCFFNYLFFKIKIKYNVLIIALLIIGFSFYLRYLNLVGFEIKTIHNWDSYLRKPVVTRLDSIMIGVIMAWVYCYKISWFKNYRKFLFTVGVIIYLIDKVLLKFNVLSFQHSSYMGMWYFFVNPFSIALMLPFFYYLPAPRNVLLKKTVTCGSLISYSLYLVNLTIVSYLIINPLHLSNFTSYFVFWALTISISILLYKYIEVPFMKMREG